MILNLGGRTTNSALLCRTPRNWISTKENKKSTCGGTIIRVNSPVCIRETMQCQRSVRKKPNTKGSSAIKITKRPFDRSLIVFGWHVQKLREFIHNKGNIRLSHSEMLEATNHLTVHGGIDRRNTIVSSQRSTYNNLGRDGFGV